MCWACNLTHRIQWWRLLLDTHPWVGQPPRLVLSAPHPKRAHQQRWYRFPPGGSILGPPVTGTECLLTLASTSGTTIPSELKVPYCTIATMALAVHMTGLGMGSYQVWEVTEVVSPHLQWWPCGGGRPGPRGQQPRPLPMECKFHQCKAHIVLCH